MTTAAETREAIDAYPFLRQALRAGVLNYRATARFLDIDDTDAGAAALRRYAEELGPPRGASGGYRVRMRSGVAPNGDTGDVILSLDETTVTADSGDATAVVVEGDIATRDVAHVLAILANEGIEPVAAGFDRGRFVLVVERTDGPRTLRCVERTTSR